MRLTFGEVKTHIVKVRYAKRLKSLGLHLKKLRTENELTQEQVAFRAGISHSTYNTLERGKLNVSISTLMAIADAMKLDIKELCDF